MSQQVCFLDLDGVLADFVAAMHKAHNRANAYDNPTNHGLWDLDKIWGMDAAQFWSTDTYEFWAEVPRMYDADRIVRAALETFGQKRVAILTAPSKGHGCVPGKREWVRRNYPELANHMIFTKAKRFIAGPNNLLVDDKDSNVLEFREAGGRAILVPRLWNSQHNLLPVDVASMVRCWL